MACFFSFADLTTAADHVAGSLRAGGATLEARLLNVPIHARQFMEVGIRQGAAVAMDMAGAITGADLSDVAGFPPGHDVDEYADLVYGDAADAVVNLVPPLSIINNPEI